MEHNSERSDFTFFNPLQLIPKIFYPPKGQTKKKTMLVGTLYSLQYGNLKIFLKKLLRNNRTFNNA